MADAPTPPAVPAPCQCGCGWWRCFLDSWATPGGNIFLLSILAIFFIFMTGKLMIWFGPATPAVMFLVPIAGGFASAIMTRMGIVLNDRSHNSRATDNQALPDAIKPTP